MWIRFGLDILAFEKLFIDLQPRYQSCFCIFVLYYVQKICPKVAVCNGQCA